MARGRVWLGEKTGRARRLEFAGRGKGLIHNKDRNRQTGQREREAVTGIRARDEEKEVEKGE